MMIDRTEYLVKRGGCKSQRLVGNAIVTKAVAWGRDVLCENTEAPL
jgi:hypothetical protein